MRGADAREIVAGLPGRVTSVLCPGAPVVVTGCAGFIGSTVSEALLELVMKRERSERGQPLMPAWSVDDEVAPHVLDLYAYLNARAAGVLGPGKPKLLPARR